MSLEVRMISTVMFRFTYQFVTLMVILVVTAFLIYKVLLAGDLYSKVNLSNLTFSNYDGTAMHCVFTHLTFQDNISFINNTAINGAAIYFEKIHSVQSQDVLVKFINNSSMQKGGALYFNIIADYCNVFPNPFSGSFINNSAEITGYSIYFSIPQVAKLPIIPAMTLL